ncbi:MAG: LamG-like jellyroll fold domain-containing protein [Gemmataceae bacterium]
MDAAPGRIQGLLLTDGYEQGFPHWQISSRGELRLGVKIATPAGALRPSGYGSPERFQPRRIGVWTCVATSYDAKEGKLRHFLDGIEVSSETLVSRQPLRIGKADIGNWSSPLAQDPTPVRNFIGRIDELTLWNVALDERELLKIHEATRP